MDFTILHFAIHIVWRANVICTCRKSGIARKTTVAYPELRLTNNLDASEELISLLYQNRWSVELFFKWIKQHLKIKKFWGTSENAVRIQIYCAIITYCLVAIVQHDMKLERSIYEVLQILGIFINIRDDVTLKEKVNWLKNNR